MCGMLIARIEGLNLDEIVSAHHSMSYRGLPEEEYNHSDIFDDYFVGHNTLPLNFLNHPSPQPVVQEGWAKVFVGEIFNWRDLDKEGKYSSDTEFVFDKFSDPSVDITSLTSKLDGFWTYAQTNGKDLVAITDYLSQKPVYYRTDCLAISSEPLALAKIKNSSVDEVYMSNCLKFGYSPDGRTPWNEIKQLPPGHIYFNGNIAKYYNWDLIHSIDLKSAFIEAVENRLFSQRKMGLLLSGGLDSSLVAAVAKNRVQAFHVENNESEFVDALGYPYTKINYDDVSIQEALQYQQTPSDLGSLLPQVALAKALKKEKLNVVLTGDGADELFGGYRRAKEYDSQMSDMFCELPYYHFPRLDRVMMKETIETRSPFMHPAVIKYAMDLPWAERTEKQHLKQLAHELHLPESIINRPKTPLKSTNVIEGGITHRINLVNEWRTTIGRLV